MSTYAIGDLQGCFQALQQLLTLIGFEPARDTLWFAGDLVNRGPQSLAVLRFIRALGDRARCVLGNHDLHLLAAAAGCGRHNRHDTLDQILTASDGPELIDWLRHQPLLYADEHFPKKLMVHAGLLPDWTASQALALAAEVQTVLRAPGWANFMASLYGNQPDHWSEHLQGIDRLRVIVNAMTRMRFCNLQGHMDFKIKTTPDQAPTGSLPWFDIPQRQTFDCQIIMGHWSALGLTIRPDLLALDTGCVWGGCLTALRLDDNRIFQVDCETSLDPISC